MFAHKTHLGTLCRYGAVLTSKMNVARRRNTLNEHKASKIHQQLLDGKDSGCSECELIVDASIGTERYLASPY